MKRNRVLRLAAVAALAFISFGSVIAEGNPAEIQRNAEVRRAYLGGTAAP